MHLRRVAAAVALVVGSIVGASAEEVAGRYLLGPQDQLRIRVYDLRRNTGEAYSWTALNGDFTVGASGTVSLPLIGSIKAAGGTPLDLAEAIGNALKKAADLAEKPSASVEVATYRPFYITGAVEQPGKYEYQPGLTVLQAVSTARGFMRGSDVRGLQRDVLSSRGDMRTLAAERISLLAKQARLEAEISGADSVAFGADLKNNTDKTHAGQSMRAEELLFETRRSSVKAETDVIESSINSFKTEMRTLDAKSKTLDRQLELSRNELNLVSDLVAKGLTIGSRKLAAEQTQASFESNRLDVQVAVLRAQQSLTRAERDIIELKARFRRDALAEAADMILKLAENEEKARTAERLTINAESQMGGSSEDGIEKLTPLYEITRRSDGQPRTWVASEEESVEPDDVVRVVLLRKQTSGSVDLPHVLFPSRPSPSGTSGRSGAPASEALQRSTDSTYR